MNFFRLFFLLSFMAATGKMYGQQDSATNSIDADTDPTFVFFTSGEKLPADVVAKTVLITKTRKTTKLSNYVRSSGGWTIYPPLSALGNSDSAKNGDYVLSDLDNDGKKELLVYNFTGGAHCCDEITIYRNIGPDKYQYVVKLFAGHTEIRQDKKFEFYFDEAFGYFFTCYACGYSDTSDAAPIPLRSIQLRYANDKINVVPGDQELRSTINDNLGKLSEHPYEEPDKELAMDEGLRKEFAMNLVVFYYSFGRNLKTTKDLFIKYYHHPDAAKVWAAFAKNLQAINKNNDF